MRNVWAVVTIVVAALMSITTLSIVGADTSGTMQVIAAAVIPTVTMLLYGERLAGKLEDQAGKLEDVHRQVNGRMGELIARNEKEEVR